MVWPFICCALATRYDHEFSAWAGWARASRKDPMTADELTSIIQAGLPCQHLSLEGDGRHWYATIVSAEFEGRRLIQRHKQVYATLGEKIKTLEQWDGVQ